MATIREPASRGARPIPAYHISHARRNLAATNSVECGLDGSIESDDPNLAAEMAPLDQRRIRTASSTIDTNATNIVSGQPAREIA